MIQERIIAQQTVNLDHFHWIALFPLSTIAILNNFIQTYFMGD